jgi:hypothetical protein
VQSRWPDLIDSEGVRRRSANKIVCTSLHQSWICSGISSGGTSFAGDPWIT